MARKLRQNALANSRWTPTADLFPMIVLEGAALVNFWTKRYRFSASLLN